MRVFIVFALALALTGQACSQPAGGGGGGGRGRVRDACRADMQRFCADAAPGGGQRMQCMREHRDQLSDECKAALASAHAHRQGGGPPDSAAPPS